jgi:iron complex outermembrane receptor protein
VPTTGRQYEVGVKYQPNGFNSFITLSGYHLTQANVLTVDPDNLSFQVQTGEIRSRGIELEAHANLAPGLNLIGTYAYNDSTVTKSNAGDVGKVPLFVPRHLGAVWGDYQFPEGKLAGLGLGLGVRYIGFTFGSTDNSLKVPGYTIVDAAVSYDLPDMGPNLSGWRVGVNVANLFDKTYVSECSSSTNCLYGLRRTVLATLRRSW